MGPFSDTKEGRASAHPSPASKEREFVLAAFLLIAAFGQFGGKGSQCSEQTIMSLVGASGEE